MAFMVDQQSNFKHFCRICKKGFMCGRALGGHMRAHGIGDESGNIDDEDPAADWEDRGNEPPANKRMYALRTNPNRLKSCRACDNCGKEFLSWKSFFEHGKCSSEDAESFLSSPESEGEDGTGPRGCGWSKRKRSLRAKVGSFNSTCPSSEEEDLAKCLMLLSNARVDPLEAEPEESCASASKEEERRKPAAFIAPVGLAAAGNRVTLDKAKGVAKGMFECKACKKVFNSHQALGGHRASHKKVKGCFAARFDHLDNSTLADEDVITHEDQFLIPPKSTSSLQFDHGPSAAMAGVSKRKSKVHECSICHRIFSSGQALGGHKRCHWITSNSPETSSLAKFHQFHDDIEQFHRRSKFSKSEAGLDLNLPAPADDMAGIRRDPKNPLSFEVSTEINLQSWIDVDAKDDNAEYYDQNNNDQDDHDNKNNINHNSMENVDDEADSKVKLAKLSELKDMNISGSSSPWLQVGIGSTTDVGADP
ncbi:zinc finger protein ZAT1-like [Cornus florida]|uniref:zinc finger protein ZAT1-like n=1 Tax=Cornus florida TaxID=4283 RepID=UPI00289922B7|nr:zinc finger protein ZAT1-like [Cornus florida]